VGTSSTSAGAGIGTNSPGAGAGITSGLAGSHTTGINGSAGIAETGSPVGTTAESTARETSKQSASPQPSGAAETATDVPPTSGGHPSLELPRVLLPQGGSDRAVTALEAIPGTSDAIVRACRGAIEAAAGPYGAVNVRAKSSGYPRRLSRGAVSAPIQVRIEYQTQGGPEVRQARIKCQLDATGSVVKLT
jgi:hypothetical protein